MTNDMVLFATKILHKLHAVTITKGVTKCGYEYDLDSNIAGLCSSEVESFKRNGMNPQTAIRVLKQELSAIIDELVGVDEAIAKLDSLTKFLLALIVKTKGILFIAEHSKAIVMLTEGRFNLAVDALRHHNINSQILEAIATGKLGHDGTY